MIWIEKLSPIRLWLVFASAAYMEIGATNVSAVIGPYLQTVASSTEKLEKPYFSTTEVESGYYRPYNLITVFPQPDDLYRIAKDVVKRYLWRDVAILYENAEGKKGDHPPVSIFIGQIVYSLLQLMTWSEVLLHPKPFIAFFIMHQEGG